MEILQKLGIPYPLDNAASKFDLLGSKPEKQQQQQQQKPITIIDPSDADDYFARLLIPVLMGSAVGSTELLDDREGLLAKYSSMCQAYAKRSASSSSFWTAEADLWNLMRVILPALPEESDLVMPKSKEAMIHAYLQSNPLLSHLLRLKEWLEESAGSFVPAELRKAPVPMTRSETCHLDPDAVWPAGMRDSLDEAWEEAQLRTLWDLLRRGRIQEAISWCFQVDQPWRAAILSGGFLPSDPLLDDPNSAETQVSGNPDRSIWKASAQALVDSPGVSQTEKALYAALIGDYNAMQPLCRDWKDSLWSSILSIVEFYIQEMLEGHPADSGKIASMLESTFSDIEKRFVKGDSVYKLIKALVLRTDYSEAAFNCLDSTSTDEFLRLASVSAMILRTFTFDQGGQPQYFDVILHAYLTRLLESGQLRHWTFFCSQLVASELRSDAFVTFLETLKEKPRDVKWFYLKEANFYRITLEEPLYKLALASVQDISVLEFMLYPEDISLRSLLIEYSAYLIRSSLLANQSLANQVLSELPLANFALLVSDIQIGPFVKELFYYNHLLQVLAVYTEWSSAYASVVAGEATIEPYHQVSNMLGEAVLKWLQSDWLGDVEQAPKALFGASEREALLMRLRSYFVSELCMLFLSVMGAEPKPSLDPSLSSAFMTILSDMELELFKEFAREHKLSGILEKLQRLRLPEDDQVRQASITFLQDVMRSSHPSLA